MAGIGFVLRKLSLQDNLIGWVRAHVNAIILATGPWLFTVVAFWAITISVAPFMPISDSMHFTTIIIYNFSFSSIFCGPVTLVSTRYIADCIFAKDSRPIPGMMIATILFSLTLQMPLAVWFYFGYLNMTHHMALQAVFNYLVICLIWLTSVYLTAIKNYHSVSTAFGSGLLLSMVLSYLLGRIFSTAGVMVGLNIGLGCCLALIIACILNEYPYPFRATMSIFSYMRRFQLLIVSGIVYNMAIWIDKWIMWFAPDATVTGTGLRVNFNYDGAMFMSYLTIIPALGVFVFQLETSFHEKYLKFYNDINRKVNFAQIQENQMELVDSLKHGINNFVAFQGIFTAVIVMLAPKMIGVLHLSFMGLGIFRFGVIGVFFHMLALFLTIILSYIDSRKSILLIQMVFLVLNASITYLTMRTDFVYYGLGYMVAAVLTFAVAAVITMWHLRLLPNHTFITNNSSIEP